MSEPSADFFVRLEAAVWEALVSGDPTADRALLSEDFLGVYPDGFANRLEHAAQLDDGPAMSAYEITSPVVRAFTDDLVLLAYEARYRRRQDSDLERMYVSSVWSRRDGGWVNVFSQDTPADD